MNFVEMTREEIDDYLLQKIEADARDGAKANAISFEQAKQIIEECMKTELPRGPQTSENHWWKIEVLVDNLPQRVGGIWIKQHGSGAVTLHGIDIFEPFRGRGLATQAMQLMEERVKGMGANRIRLHVYPTNRAAWKLYTRVNFRPVSLFMEKIIQ